ncbi:MAG: hypothetical protein GY796_21370 [Chloroflexi bacterium]|nr:hypothetical protein [Chloroflexota bacterium]
MKTRKGFFSILALLSIITYANRSGLALAVGTSVQTPNANNSIFLPIILNQKPPATILVSVSSDGTQGNDASGSLGLSISADGRYVAFESLANNLVPNDINDKWDVFLRDLLTGEIEIISLAYDGSQGNNDSGRNLIISLDGRYVVYESWASNLIPSDTNESTDTFIYDRISRTTTLVSKSSNGEQANEGSYQPAISTNGRYVAFYSVASNLVSGDSNDTWDVFVHDIHTGTTVLVSKTSEGFQGNDTSTSPSMSGDGRYVAFGSLASNLVLNDTNQASDIFIHDTETGITKRVSLASDGTQGNGSSYGPSLSADGRYVAFMSFADNLVENDKNNYADVFVHDTQTGTTQLVTKSTDGVQGSGGIVGLIISADGRYIAFGTISAVLVPDDTNEAMDVFIHDRLTGVTELVSKSSDGTLGNASSGAWELGISANGCSVAFHSHATNLVDEDTNGTTDVFVRDCGR